MSEILVIIYQWHQGAGFKAIRRSLGFDRNTVRKYVRMAQSVGVERGRPLPDEGELSSRLKAVQDAEILYETPAQHLIDSHRDWVGSLLEKDVQGKQIWRLFQEKTGLLIGYSTLKRYLRQRLDGSLSSAERATRDAYLSVVADAARIEALRQSVASSRSALRATQRGVEGGNRTIVDVLDSRQRVFEAERDYASARYNYLTNLVRLRAAAGSLLPADLEAINAYLVETVSVVPSGAPRR